jgi:hypothetical protein
MRKSVNVTYVKYQYLYMMTVFNGLTQFGISNPVTIFASEWQEIFIESENPYRDIKRAASAFSKAMVQ